VLHAGVQAQRAPVPGLRRACPLSCSAPLHAESATCMLSPFTQGMPATLPSPSACRERWHACCPHLYPFACRVAHIAVLCMPADWLSLCMLRVLHACQHKRIPLREWRLIQQVMRAPWHPPPLGCRAASQAGQPRALLRLPWRARAPAESNAHQD
jgi:hypothetical protein